MTEVMIFYYVGNVIQKTGVYFSHLTSSHNTRVAWLWKGMWVLLKLNFRE